MLAQALLRDAKQFPRTNWTRAAGNPVLSPSVAWESTAVEEPTVLYESGTWKMWYTGGWTSPGLGYATCTTDPTVAGNWTKYASNPVLGQGGSGVAGFVAASTVRKFGSTYYCWYEDALGGGNLKCSTSSDGIVWNTPVTVLTAGTPSWCFKFTGDVEVWGTSGAWKMLGTNSGSVGGGQPFQTYYATSSATTPDSGWTVQGTGPLTSLQPTGVTGVYGSIELAYNGTLINGRYYAWYHVGNGNFSDIVLAYSTDAQNWTIITSPQFQMQHNTGAYEAQQVADPSVVEVNGVSYLLYDGVNNSSSTSYINVATYPGTLANKVLWET